MYVLTNKEMREADEYTVQTLGVPSLTLMEKAGRAIAEKANELSKTGKILCVCGGGNNGGDGYVCARYLKTMGREVDTLCIAEKFSADCLENKKKWEALQGTQVSDFKWEEYALAVDCLYGTGFKGQLKDKDKQLVLKINAFQEKGGIVLSADIPSGINGENGIVDGIAVHADNTLCIGELKTGILLGDGKDHAGKVEKVDIGIRLPHAKYPLRVDNTLVSAMLPKRKQNSHKGAYGKAAVVGGHREYTGAPALAMAASLRSGVGYTTLFTPKSILPYFYLKYPEVLLKQLDGEDGTVFNEKQFSTMLDFSSVAYGMGMGCSEQTYLGAKYLLKNYEGKLLIDADGLNSLAKYGKEDLKTLFLQKKCSVLLTPHVKELSRLTGAEVENILKAPIETAKNFAEENQVNVLLKGVTTVLTDGEKVYLNDAGNSGQAKAGSGDALSGLIAGLCAQGINLLQAGVSASYLLGKSAELLAKEKTEYAITPSDCIENLGSAYRLVL